VICSVLGSPARSTEARVLLTPREVKTFIEQGATVIVEAGAGRKAGFSDHAYEDAGARVVQREEALRRGDITLSVARPGAHEVVMLPEGAALLGLLHVGVDSRELSAAAEGAGVRLVSLDQVVASDGRLPFRSRMAAIAGALCAPMAARLLETGPSRGVLLGGLPGVPPAAVVIVGAGVLGSAAARAFSGLGASVTVLDKRLAPMEKLSTERLPGVITVQASPAMLKRAATWADVLVGAVYEPGRSTPRVLSPRDGKPGAVWLDMAVDEGGCLEGSRPVAGPEDAYLDNGVLCCPIPNMASRVARTSSHVLSGLVAPRLRAALAGTPLEEALR